MLAGRALKWWNTLSIELGQEAIARSSWNDVKTLMKSEFYTSGKSRWWGKSWRILKCWKMITPSTFADFKTYAFWSPHRVTPESRQIEQYIRGLNPRLREMANAVYPLTMQRVSNKVEYSAVDILSQTPLGKDNKSWDQSSSSQDKRDISRFQSQMSILPATPPVDDAMSYMPSV